MWIFLAKSFISSSDKRYLYFEKRKYSFCWSACTFSGIRNPLHFSSLLFGYLNIHFKERIHGHSMAPLPRKAGTSPLPLSLVGRVHRFIRIEPRQECWGIAVLPPNKPTRTFQTQFHSSREQKVSFEYTVWKRVCRRKLISNIILQVILKEDNPSPRSQRE